MTARQFAKGDTVRVRSNNPKVALHGRTGELIGYTDSGRYARVRFGPAHVELLLRSEMEPVTDVA